MKTTKRCIKCNENRGLDEFYKDETRIDGVNGTCKSCQKSRLSQYYKDNTEKAKARSRDWYRDNHDRARLRRNTYKSERLKNNVDYRVLENMRRRVHHVISGTAKSAPTLKLLGCSREYLRNHIEQQFTEGMTWDNIHVDHILPISAFNMKFKKHQRYAFHWSNIQPLLAADNLSKADSYCPDELKAYLKSKLPTPSL